MTTTDTTIETTVEQLQRYETIADERHPQRRVIEARQLRSDDVLTSTGRVVEHVDVKTKLVHVYCAGAQPFRLRVDDQIEIERVERTPLAMLAGTVLQLHKRFRVSFDNERQTLVAELLDETRVETLLRRAADKYAEDCKLVLREELRRTVDTRKRTTHLALRATKAGDLLDGKSLDRQALLIEARAWMTSMSSVMASTRDKLVDDYWECTSSSYVERHMRKAQREAARDHVHDLASMITWLSSDITSVLAGDDDDGDARLARLVDAAISRIGSTS